MFDDLLQDLDPKYAQMSSGVGGTFLKEKDLVEGFVGTYKGYERKEASQFGPTTWWKFETEAGEPVILNRPHYREVEDKESGAKMKKPTRFLVSFMGAKLNEGDKVEIKQTGKGYKIEYLIKKS